MPEITYKLEYDHSDIVVSFSDADRGCIEKLLRNEQDAGNGKTKPLFTPKEVNGFRDSLDFFCREFYPHMLSSETELPWGAHLAAASAKTKDRKNKLDAIVKLATNPWPLAWYWKALFTGFAGLLEGDGHKTFGDAEIVVRIAQIRQWVLVLVYTEKNGRRNLLRPPLFGYSERIANWDQYLALLQHCKAISKAWTAAQSRLWPGADRDYRKHEEKHYVLGRHDMEYRLRPADIRSLSARVLEIPVSFSIELNPHIKYFSDSDIKEDFAWVGSMGEDVLPTNEQQIHYPYDIVEIPIFQDAAGSTERAGKPERILLASDAVCKAYESLSEIWNDRMARCVLIIAPPGSGKELLARSIHQFQKRPKARLVSYALSPSSDGANEQMLYSRSFSLSPHEVSLEDHEQIERKKKRALAAVETDEWLTYGTDGALENSNTGKTDENTRRPIMLPDDGLVFRSRKGVLFLDEIDKVSDCTRAGLLRLLENGEFALYGTPMVLRLKKWRPLYVFAGSMPKDEMFKKEPADFWTRMSHLIEMDHPLDAENVVVTKRVARSYFWFFWVERLAKSFTETELVPFPYELPQEICGDEEAKRRIEERNTQVVLQKAFFQDYFVMVFRIFNDPDIIDYLASAFALELSQGGGIRRFSIRSIRSIAGLIRFSLLDLLLYNKIQSSALRKIRDRITQSGRPAVVTKPNGRRGSPVEIVTVEGNKLSVWPLSWFEAVKYAIVGSGKLFVYDDASKNESDGSITRDECEELRNEIRKMVSLALRKVFL